MKKIINTLLSMSLISVASAQVVITQTENFAFVPSGAQTLNFSTFDSTLGTLNSVTVSVLLNKEGGNLQVDNDSAEGGSIILTHGVVGSLTSTDVSLVDLTGNVIGGSGSLSTSDSFTTTVGASSGDATNAFNATGAADFVTFNPTDTSVSDSGGIFFTADYETIGAGSFALDVNAIQTTNAAGLGGLQQAFTVSNVSGAVTVEYNFTAVPEPSSTLLSGIGLLGLMARRRR